MRGSCARITLAVLTISIGLAQPAWPQRELPRIQADYAAADAELHRHLQFEQWLDNEPGTPEVLARYWALVREWVAAWMDAHPAEGMQGAKTALTTIAPSESPRILVLNENTVLVAAPGAIGNVFIVIKASDRHRVAWSIDQAGGQPAKFADTLADWRAGSPGSLVPALGALPEDRQGRARFYIDAAYAQSAGGSGTKQFSLWIWDGQAARALVMRDYRVTWFQSKITRLEGDILKVHEKRQFRMFFACAGCEERQTDWIMRVTPDGVEDLGEISTVPELDAVDELFYRLTRGEPATRVASPEAIAAATSLLEKARDSNPGKDFREANSLGMIMSQSGQRIADNALVCLATFDIDLSAFRLKRVDDGWYVASIAKGTEACGEGQARRPDPAR
ncbi:hypothetical protein [Paludibaculum fermentans]|uniref:hypothetical protein n=1 Tax=Paludibaculum fermentans TaxID=1473598 RepID=UPI003EBE0C99